MNDLHLVRQLEPHQIIQLRDLYKATWWTENRSLDAITHMLANSQEIFALLDSHGDLYGFSRVLTDYVYKAFIFDVIVAASYQDSGWGSYLMDTILNEPNLAQVLHFELYCKPEMAPYYKRWGFHSSQDLCLMRRVHQGQDP